MDTVGDTLRIHSVTQLGMANANAFRDWVRGALNNGHRNIEVDLSQATLIDSCGLGALIALHKSAVSRKGKLVLTNPQLPILQILELTRLDSIFDIVRQ
jgi:anti-sigma B factor antagonist